ncbi:DNA polymerase II [Halomonadaceae bacterium LMG 33818]|uniref:DNA polymerase II n=1 Tax=Cernens ardua TaxID=3402176 RepID=UPI003EDB97E1
MNADFHRGFLLTRHWRDTPQGVVVSAWLATDYGPVHVELKPAECVAFIPEHQLSQAEPLLQSFQGGSLRPLTLKNFEGQTVMGLYSLRYRTLLQVTRQLKSAGVRVYEEDIRPADRYLMERGITAPVRFIGHRLSSERWSNVQLRPDPDYRPPLRMVSLDIETSGKGELYSIGVQGGSERHVFMLGPPSGELTRQDMSLHYGDTRKAVIESFVEWLQGYDPDVLIGWNVIQFDLQVLIKEAKRANVRLALGRDGSEPGLRKGGAGGKKVFADIVGRLVIDGIDALKSAFWHFPSFSLEAVSQTLLGDGKAISTPYQRLDEILRLFAEDKASLAMYNLKDCELVTRIFEHTALITFLLERASVTGLEADRMGGSVAAFSHLYLPKMHRLGRVAPSVGEQEIMASPGGFVMDSRPGLYDSVLVLDFKSLYPSIIRTFLIDPVGLVEGLATVHGTQKADAGQEDHAELSMTTVEGYRGAHFSRTHHALPAIIAQLWEGREEAKSQGNVPLSQALKIIMNACYGVLGSPSCRFFDTRLASSITLRGHEIIQRTRDYIERQGVDVIYGDTDSVFIWLKRPYSEEDAMVYGKELVKKVNAWWKQTLAEELCVESVLELQYERHFSRFLMPTIRGTNEGSKKRYAGLVKPLNASSDVIFKGLETVRSDWTPLAQRFQRELYARIFKKQPYVDYVREFVDRTRRSEWEEDMVFRKRIRRPLSEYKRNVPPQVRAAIMADEYNVAHGRPQQYQRGGWISYVMTVNGPEPLECHSSPLDVELYVMRQLKPVADGILPFVDEDFDTLISDQITLL